MTRFAKIPLVAASALALALTAPATRAGDTTCVTELAGVRYYAALPPGGTCVDTTYDVAVDHCAAVWNGDYEAVGWSFGGKWASGGRFHAFSCSEGTLTAFAW